MWVPEKLEGVRDRAPARGSANAFDIQVSVVTVVFNAVKSGRSGQFRQCLESVQAQQGVTVEHLVVDGGSQDGTMDLVEAFVNERQALRVFSSGDEGIYHAMNRGIALARGRYVLFLNSDDYLHNPHGLAASVARLEETGADFSYGPARVLDDEGREIDHPFVRACPYPIGEGMPICHQTILTDRAALERLEGFDRQYRSSADFDLFLRMVFAGLRGCRVDEPVATFRYGGYSFVNKDLGDGETGTIYATLFNRHLGTEYTLEDGIAFRRKGVLPEYALAGYRPFGVSSFGDDYRPDDATRQLWNNLYDQRLDRALAGSVLRRWLPLSPVRRLLQARFMDRCLKSVWEKMIRISAHDRSSVDGELLYGRAGIVAVGPVRISCQLPGHFRNRRLRILVLLKTDAKPGAAVPRVRFVADGVCLGEQALVPSEDLQLVPVRVPAAQTLGRPFRLEMALTEETGKGAVLVFGGLGICR